MEVSPLNEDFLAAKDAALSHEDALAAAVELVLNEAIDDSVRRYTASAEALTAAGPHVDEVFNGTKTGQKLNGAISNGKKAAAKSYTDELPTCVLHTGPGVPPLPADLDRDWLRATLDKIDSEKAAGKNPRGLMDKIRERAGMSPTKARKALEAEGSARLAGMPERERVGQWFYEEPAVVDEALYEEILDWPGGLEEDLAEDTASDVAGAAFSEVEQGIGRLLVLREANESLAAVANIERGTDAIIVHNIAAKGGAGAGTMLLRKIALDASRQGIGVRLLATPEAMAYYRKLGWVSEGGQKFFLPADRAGAFASGRSLEPPGPLALPDAERLASVQARNEEWNKAATYLTGRVNADPRNLPGNKWKSNIAGRLAKRLQESPEWRALVRTWGGRKAGPINTGNEVAGSIIRGWAGTSSDRNPIAQAVQRAVQEEFGLSPKAMTVALHGASRAAMEEVYAEYGVALRQFVRAMYEQTQEDLAAAGYKAGDSITLYRGMGLDSRHTPFELGMERTPFIHVGETEIGLQPASSYSVSLGTAASFSVDFEGSGAEAQMIFASKVPIERILGSARSGFGCIGETEFVVLGEREGVIDRSIFAGAESGTEAGNYFDSNSHEFWDWVKNDGRIERPATQAIAKIVNGKAVVVPVEEPVTIGAPTGIEIPLTDAMYGAHVVGEYDTEGNIIVTEDELKAADLHPDAQFLNEEGHYVEVIVAAGGKCDGIEISWDVKNPFFGKAYAVSAEKVTQITDTTRVRIMRTLKDSYDNGLSVRDTAKKLEALKGINAARARLIARTEMTALINGAAQAAAKVISDATGDIYKKQWLTAPGAEHPRHEDYPGLDGQTVEMEELFDVGGVALEYPGDPAGPPDEVCNCRCTLLLIEPGGSTQQTEAML